MGARAVQKSFHESSSLNQPQSDGHCGSGWRTIAWLQMCSVSYAARLACSLSAPYVGGIKSYDLRFRAKRASLASFTGAIEPDLSYIRTPNFSRICRTDYSIFDGHWLSFVKMTDCIHSMCAVLSFSLYHCRMIHHHNRWRHVRRAFHSFSLVLWQTPVRG